MDFEPDHDPLLDDDEVVDFLLYREMERESARPPRGGCLGAVLLRREPRRTVEPRGRLAAVVEVAVRDADQQRRHL